jgi:LmbE family N-acetylglucosaminyl deacetylase
MLKFALANGDNRGIKVLCVGAHSDDIEIGCGGTILRLLAEHDNVDVHWVVLGSSGQREEEAIRSANEFLAGARTKDVVIRNFKDGFFPYMGDEIKGFFEELKRTISPDIVFTHYRDDRHQDHHLISDLTWNTYRNHLILEYEIIKYDGDIGGPNLFVHLDDSVCRKKIDLIMSSFKTQGDKDWFTQDTFLALARIRGIESKAPGRYAEGFYCRKMVL